MYLVEQYQFEYRTQEVFPRGVAFSLWQIYFAVILNRHEIDRVCINPHSPKQTNQNIPGLIETTISKKTYHQTTHRLFEKFLLNVL